MPRSEAELGARASGDDFGFTLSGKRSHWGFEQKNVVIWFMYEEKYSSFWIEKIILEKQGRKEDEQLTQGKH